MEEIAATAAAVQNMHLTAHAYGLGAYWSTGGITFIEEAKALFNLGPDDKLMGFFYLGYIKVPGTDGQRAPIEEKGTLGEIKSFNNQKGPRDLRGAPLIINVDSFTLMLLCIAALPLQRAPLPNHSSRAAACAPLLPGHTPSSPAQH